MSLQLGNVTFDCQNALAIGTFWAAALDRPLDDGSGPGFASIDDGRLSWLFIEVPEAKAAKNRVHVDLRAESRDVEVARLLELGAQRVADHDENGTQWTTLVDVEGNEFCVS
jgi:hypothetical protein